MEETKAIEPTEEGGDMVETLNREFDSAVDRRHALKLKHRQWWISLSIYIVLVITGKSSVSLLQNFYYVQTGRDVCDDPNQFTGTWIQALIQNAAFPLFLLPLLLFSPKISNSNSNTNPRVNSVNADNPSSSSFPLVSLYLSLGVLLAAYSKLYAVGKTHTYLFFPWISATQLVLTSIFAAFINKHKFNRWIIISIIVSSLAAFFGVADDAYLTCEGEGYKNEIGTWCTVTGTLVFSLSLCVTQLGFQKIIPKRRNRCRKGFLLVLEIQFYISMVAALICLVGFLASGEFRDMREEFGTFGKGKSVYVLSLIGLGISWQVWSVGLIGLVWLVSCIFSNAMSLCGSPVAAILVALAFRFMDDDVDWWKLGSVGFGVLGSAAYIYTLYKTKKKQLLETTQTQNHNQA